MRGKPRIVTYNFADFLDRYKYLMAYMGGIILGTVLFNILRRSYEVELVSYGKYLFGAVNADTTGTSMFFAVLWQRIREMIICIIMVFTPFSKVYGAFLGLKYGLCASVVLSMAIACYDSMGIVVFLMSVLPYGIFLIIGIYMMIRILDEKNATISNVLPLIVILIIESVFEG